VDCLRVIVSHRLEIFDIDVGMDALIAPDALPALAASYQETKGSIRHVFAALEVAAAAAIDNGAARLEVGHVRLGVEDWRGR